MITITAKTDTFLKKFPKDSTELSDDQVHLVRAGTGFRVKAINPKLTEGHNYITLDKPIGPNGYNSWYIWMPHWNVVEDTRSAAKEPTLLDWPNKGKETIFIPGLGERLGSDRVDGTQHFTWNEATKNGTRIPTGPETTNRIMAIAHVMDSIRNYYDRPITITSWYRTPEANRQAGGATQSRHLKGDAVDFVVQGVHPREVFKYVNRIYRKGGIGNSNHFTHIDARGYYCTWNYGQ